MRRCVQAVAFAAILLAGTRSYADPIAVGDIIHVLGSDSTIWGGAFQVDNTSNGDGVDFLTFCLQLHQDIDYTNLFRVGAITDYADDNDGDDPVDPETLWIFSNYRRGVLSAFSSDEIQAAIWIIEQEWTTHMGNSAALMAMADAAVDAGWANDGVQALQLFYLDGSRAQDQLIYSQTPEPGTLLLVGGGIAALVRRGRKRKQGSCGS